MINTGACPLYMGRLFLYQYEIRNHLKLNVLIIRLLFSYINSCQPAQSETVSSFALRRLVTVEVPRMRQPEQSEGSFSYTAPKGKTRPLGLRAPKPAIESKSIEAAGMYIY
jgi:hypothetical protein